MSKTRLRTSEGRPSDSTYATERYTFTGERFPAVTGSPAERHARTRASLIAGAMLLLSFLATGLLFASM